MAITIVGQPRGTRNAEITSETDSIGYATTVIYTVFDDSGTASEADILTTSGLPITNDPFNLPGVPYRVACKSKKCEQWERNKKYWTVTCDIVNYEFPVWIPGTGEGGSVDPESWEPMVKLSFEQIDEVITQDVNGNAIVNTAKRKYAAPITIQKLVPVWKFTQYESQTLSLGEITSRHGKVNNEIAFRNRLVYQVDTLLLLVDGADIVYKNGQKYWKIDYCIKYKSRPVKNCLLLDPVLNKAIDDPATIEVGWQLPLMQIDYLDVFGKPLRDKNKMEIEDYLDKNGLQLYDRTANESGEPLFLKHEIYDRIDFNFLRI